LNDSSTELHPYHFLIVDQLVDPVQNIKDLIASQTSHVTASYDFHSLLFVDDIKLRDDCKSLQPNGKTPEIFEVIVSLRR
jgi:hypothetical protein